MQEAILKARKEAEAEGNVLTGASCLLTIAIALPHYFSWCSTDCCSILFFLYTTIKEETEAAIAASAVFGTPTSTPSAQSSRVKKKRFRRSGGTAGSPISSGTGSSCAVASTDGNYGNNVAAMFACLAVFFIIFFDDFLFHR